MWTVSIASPTQHAWHLMHLPQTLFVTPRHLVHHYHINPQASSSSSSVHNSSWPVNPQSTCCLVIQSFSLHAVQEHSSSVYIIQEHSSSVYMLSKNTAPQSTCYPRTQLLCLHAIQYQHDSSVYMLSNSIPQATSWPKIWLQIEELLANNLAHFSPVQYSGCPSMTATACSNLLARWSFLADGSSSSASRSYKEHGKRHSHLSSSKTTNYHWLFNYIDTTLTSKLYCVAYL